MVGCSGAQINLSVKSATPASSQRLSGARHRGVAVQDLETWAKGCRGGKKRPEGIRGSRRAPPYGAGQHGRRSNRAVSRHTKRAPAENRRTAMKKGQPKLVAVGRRFTMELKEKRQ